MSKTVIKISIICFLSIATGLFVGANGQGGFDNSTRALYIFVRHKRRKHRLSGNFAAKRQVNGNSPHTLHTLASPTSRHLNQSLPKSAIFAYAHLKR